MSSIRRNGIVFAMEEDEVPPVEEVALVPETQAEVEADSAELTEQVGDVEEMTEASDDAVADTDTLGEIQTVMADSVEKGEGLDETAAEIAEVAVESICRRLGIKNAKVIPSMESFGAKGSRLAATKIAMENIGETIAKVWKAILAVLKRTWEMIKSFFANLFKSTTMLKKHLEGLQKRVDGFEGEQKPTISNGGVIKAFNTGTGKCDMACVTTMVSHAEELLAMAPGVLNASNAFATYLQGAVKEAQEGKGAAAIDSADGKAKDLANVIGEEIKKATPAGQPMVVIGGKELKVNADFKNNENTFNSIGMAFTLEEVKGEAAKEAATLNKVDMSAALKAGMDLLAKLVHYQTVQKELETVNKNCEAVATSILALASKGLGKEGDAASGKQFSDAAKAIQGVNKVAFKFASSIPGIAFKTVKEIGDYVSASLAASGAKEEPKPAEAPAAAAA